MRDGAIEAAEMQLNAPVSSSTPGSSGKPSCDNTAPEERNSFDVYTAERASSKVTDVLPAHHTTGVDAMEFTTSSKNFGVDSGEAQASLCNAGDDRHSFTVGDVSDVVGAFGDGCTSSATAAGGLIICTYIFYIYILMF